MSCVVCDRLLLVSGATIRGTQFAIDGDVTDRALDMAKLNLGRGEFDWAVSGPKKTVGLVR